MNKYYERFKQPYNTGWNNGSRDPVFKWVCESYLSQIKNPKILTIGAERNLDVNSRAGDGWADFWFAEFIRKHGGELVVVDVDKTAIENCRIILGDFSELILFIQDDGLNWIQKEEWDLIYLDGGDDPKEMLKQYELINTVRTFVLFDDYSTKGTLVASKYNPTVLQVNRIHQMAFDYRGPTKVGEPDIPKQT